MRSVVWAGDPAETQPFGRTTLSVEPWWSAKGCHWHCGVDIGLVKGSRLQAARAGKVACVGYGLLAIQVGSELDWYVHIDRAVVRDGQVVTQNQLVAYSGDKVPSGGSLTGPHLHFEIQRGTFHVLASGALAPINVPETSIDPTQVLSGGDNDMLSFRRDPKGAVYVLDASGKRWIARPEYDRYIQQYGSEAALKIIDISAVEAAAIPNVVTAPAGAVDMAPVLAAIADLKAHPAATDPSLKATIDALSKHLGVGTP